MGLQHISAMLAFCSHLLSFGTTRHTVLRRVSVCRCFSVSCRFSGTYLPGVLGTCLTSWTCSGSVALDCFLLYELNCLFSLFICVVPFLSAHSVGTYAGPLWDFVLVFVFSVCLFSCMTIRNSLLLVHPSGLHSASRILFPLVWNRGWN